MKKLSTIIGVTVFIFAAFLARTYFCSPTLAYCGKSQQEAVTGSINQIVPGYLEYSEAALALAQTRGKVVLYFWAPWCTSCSTLDQELLKDPTLIPSGVTLLRIEYDHADALKARYHVTTQHTFVQIDALGEPLTSWVGGDTLSWVSHLR